jgi:peptidylprolyl isomerase
VAPSAAASPTFSIGDGPAPTVTGAFDAKPTVVLPSGTPSNNLVVKTVIQGNGPAVKKGDLLVADYLGEIWNTAATVFDSSFDRGVPSAFPIGLGQVIPGWDAALVGVKTGSRVVLVVPPAAGYGSAGESDAGITGSDTLVFVVDIINTYDNSLRANGTKTSASLKGLPAVTGAINAQPTVKVPKGEAPPAKAKAILLFKGTGAPVTAASLVVAQYVAVGWDNTAVADTWTNSLPGGLNVGISGSPSPFDELEGKPIGSRVLLLIPAQSGQDAKTASIAAVIDIVATERSAGAK